VVTLVAVAALAACGGDDEVSIDSGSPQVLPTTTSTTTTTVPDDEDDDRGHGERTKEEISCDDDPEPHVSGVIGDVEISDFCDKVTVTGVGLDVRIEATSELEISGTNHRIRVSDEVDRVHLTGGGHEVKVPDLDSTELDDESFDSDVHD